MKALKLWRTFREGIGNYRRNGWLTFATVSVLTLSLFVMSLTSLLGFAGGLAVRNLENKLSVMVSFNPDVTEERMLAIKADLERFHEIRSIEYISRDRAMEDFLRRGGSSIAAAVEVLDENPLYASLIVRASDPSYYSVIVDQIQKSQFASEINRVNYDRNRDIIDRFTELTATIKKIGIVIGTIFALIAILITWNTIRLTIYSQRQEFEVMRLVGASNLYIKMPLFFEGILYGITAALLTVILLGAVVYFLSGPLREITATTLEGMSLFHFYLRSLWLILPAATLFGTGLGILSSFIAIRKYLKI